MENEKEAALSPTSLMPSPSPPPTADRVKAMPEDVAKNIALFLGLPNLRPLQKEVVWRLHQRCVHSPKESNVLFLQCPTGTGKTFHALIYLAYYEIYHPTVKFVILFMGPLQRALDGCIAKVAKIESLRAVQLGADTWNEVGRLLTAPQIANSTIIFFNPSSAQQLEQLVVLVGRAQFLRIRMLIGDEIALMKQWMSPSFRPVLRTTLCQLADTIRERHFYNWNVPTCVMTAAASQHTKTTIQTRMGLQFNSSIIVSPNRPGVQLISSTHLSADKATAHLRKLVKEFISSKDVGEKVIVLHRGTVDQVKRLQESIQKVLNPGEAQIIEEPVGAVWSGSLSGNFEINQYRIKRMCSSNVPSTRVLIGTDRGLGVGTDLPGTTMVIHHGPPSTVEEVAQYLGRNRKEGVAHFLCTWMRRCSNAWYVHRVLQDINSDQEMIAEANQELTEVDTTAELLMYPPECQRVALEGHFYSGDSCKTCRQSKLPFCTGCYLSDAQSLLFDLKTFVPTWLVREKKKLQQNVEWHEVANGNSTSLGNLHVSCIRAFMEEHGKTPVGTKKNDLVDQLYTLCVQVRFDERKMMKCVTLRLVNAERKTFGLLVGELAHDMKIEKIQARDVVQRLILHRTLQDEPPANMTRTAATSSLSLDLWRVSRGPSWTHKPPMLQHKERRQFKMSKRKRKQ